jgi:hypothetical protein
MGCFGNPTSTHRLGACCSSHPAAPGIQPPAREAAVADLRYLGTSAAAQVIAQHLRDDEPAMMYQCTFGLIGLPETVRPKAIAAMDKLILDPDFPISSWFITTLSVLQIVAQEPERQQIERVQLSDETWNLYLRRCQQREVVHERRLCKHCSDLTQRK